MTRFFRNDRIEELAERRVAEFQKLLSTELPIPVPVDLVAELVFGLSILWEPIEELAGEVVLGSLQPKDRLIVLNEGRRRLFDSKPALIRTTIGHELGHWDLFTDESTLDHPGLFSSPLSAPLVFRSSARGPVQILSTLCATESGIDLLRRIRSRSDETDEARAVNRYSAAILMPKKEIVEAARGTDRTHWANLYRLARRFGVSISALRVRLEQLNLLYVSDGGELFGSRAEAVGQSAFAW